MGYSDSSLHGSFSAQIDNYLLKATTEFAGFTKTTTNKNLGINKGNCHPVLFFWGILEKCTPHLIGKRNNNEKPGGEANLGSILVTIF